MGRKKLILKTSYGDLTFEELSKASGISEALLRRRRQLGLDGDDLVGKLERKRMLNIDYFMSWDEIAHEMGLDRSSVRKIGLRAIAKIKNKGLMDNYLVDMK